MKTPQWILKARWRRLMLTLSIWASAWASLLGCGDNTTPAASTTDTGADTGASDPDTGLPALTCLPNLDGEISADEMQAVIGIPATYFVSAEGSAPTVDLRGQDGPDGQKLWDLSGRSASDTQLALAAQPLTGKWYADQFPNGDFVVAFNTSGTLEAIYHKDTQRFDLLGLASAEPDPPQGRTLMIYQSPVMLYQFPVKVGQQWIASSTVQEAMLNGLPYAGRDTYEVSIEAIGDLKLPELTFRNTLMTRTRVTLAPSVGVSVTQQQVSFLFECYGEVARVTSASGEQEPFFTQALSLRRLGIPE